MTTLKVENTLKRQGFYAPSLLLLYWGPWVTERSLLCRN